MSLAEFKRSSLEVGEWIWGSLQGGFNDKISIGQIVLDATISAFPIAGEITAVRDVIAQLIKMCKSPKLWEEVMEWVVLLLPLLAIIPLFGGLLKGIGKLLMRVGKNAAEDKKIVEAIILLCNRLGHGNAVKFLKELDFLKYQGKLIEGFKTVCQRLDDTLRITGEKLKSVLPKDVLTQFTDLRTALAKLKERGDKMIPEGLKELNAKLKKIQTQLYSGEWHTVETGAKNTTREAEARLVEHGAPKPHPKSKGFKQNTLEDYHPQEGFPDMAKRKYKDKLGQNRCDVVEAFSGPIKAKKLAGPRTVYRVLRPGKNGKASPWWTETMPSNGEEWREGLAVLDNFNMNNFFIKFDIPAGRELKVWEGKAAEQFNKDTGQFLGGGAVQVFIDWPVDLKAAIEKLPALSTGWGNTLKKYGYDLVTSAKNEASVQKLANSEYALKKTATGTK